MGQLQKWGSRESLHLAADVVTLGLLAGTTPLPTADRCGEGDMRLMREKISSVDSMPVKRLPVMGYQRPATAVGLQEYWLCF